MSEATILLDPDSVESYRLFLRLKGLPRCRFVGRTARVPTEYLHALGMAAQPAPQTHGGLLPGLFDYQTAGVTLGLRKRKFAFFWDCGLGKTLVFSELCRLIAPDVAGGKTLIVSPLMVIPQTLAEVGRFYGGSLRVEQVRAAGLQAWLDGEGGPLGITNYEAIKQGLRPGKLAMLCLDESSMLKSHYGAWGRRLIELGRGLEYKFCFTGTPAPNDRIEYANHAVFLDRFPTVNSFLAKFFVNRGKTGERWELKPHALRPFYRALSDWCLFLSDPATYGWSDNVGTIPPILTQEHDVPLTDEQRSLVSSITGDMHGSPGGITSRSKLGQLAKGTYRGRAVATRKPEFVRDLVASWPGEQTLVWCIYNREQEALEELMPEAASIKGTTKDGDRVRLLDEFKSGRRRTLISKASVLGFGLNLQCATRQVFSGLEDSYEDYYQCVKRSNRVGSTRPLNVHLPVTEIERAMVETVLHKAARVGADTREQEALFREVSLPTL